MLICAGLMILFISACATPAKDAGRADYNRFGVWCAKHGFWQEANHWWQKALEDASDNPFVLNNLAVAAERNRDYVLAKQYYLRAQQLAPENAKIKRNARDSGLLTRASASLAPPDVTEVGHDPQN